MSEQVPERVRRAEERRRNRQLLEDSSLGCPDKACDHGLRQHDTRMVGGFKVKNIRCRAKGCPCRG